MASSRESYHCIRLLGTANLPLATAKRLEPELRVLNDPLSDQRRIGGATVPTIGQGWELLQANR